MSPAATASSQTATIDSNTVVVRLAPVARADNMRTYTTINAE